MKNKKKEDMLNTSHSGICRGFLEAARCPAQRRWWIISEHLMAPARRMELIEDTMTRKEGEESESVQRGGRRREAQAARRKFR